MNFNNDCLKCDSHDVKMELLDSDYDDIFHYAEWNMCCLSCGYKWKRIEHYRMDFVENEDAES